MFLSVYFYATELFLMDYCFTHLLVYVWFIHHPVCFIYSFPFFTIISLMFSSFQFHLTFPIHLFSFFSFHFILHAFSFVTYHVLQPLLRPVSSVYSLTLVSSSLSLALTSTIPSCGPCSLPWALFIVAGALACWFLVLCLVSETGSGVWIGQVRAACLALCLSI